jgi:uncharacterized protein
MIALSPQPSELGQAVEKEHRLRSLMREMRSVLVAYSGGVDSAFLAFVAKQELGTKALCILGLSPSVSEHQRNEAARVARESQFSFETLETHELENPDYRANPSNRCYFCKDELYSQLAAVAERRGIEFIVDGTNFDDTADHRPGRAAAERRDVRSPLAEVGLTKSEIRELSRLNGLPDWERPASPCLASRIAYGVPVTLKRLSKIEQGESVLRQMGFKEFRVRVHGDLVRLEISPVELDQLLSAERFKDISTRFRKLGFRYVTLDLEGFRSGSMNEVLSGDSTKK